MASLTSRGKAVAGLAFLLSAVLCAGAAVALVRVSDREPADGTAAPKLQPTLIFGSTSPTPTPRATAVVTATPRPTPRATVSPAASPRPSATATRSASPRPRATTSPQAERPAGLAASTVLDPQSGDIYPTTPVTLTARATDGQGDIRLRSLDWGDGTVITGGSGKACPAPRGGDCADFAFTHNFPRAGEYSILLQITSGSETAVVPYTIEIQPCSGPCATPTPTSSS